MLATLLGHLWVVLNVHTTILGHFGAGTLHPNILLSDNGIKLRASVTSNKRSRML